jgi:serine-type D-Ala-D-Ala carboxypeptidase (penicillin-binding protein 5/6)
MDSEKENLIQRKYLVFDGLLVLFIATIAFFVYTVNLEQKKVEVLESTENKQTRKIIQDVKITAKSAYVFDVYKNEVIYEKNSKTQLPLASLTKLMMALTAWEVLPPDSKITIKKEFLSEDGDSGLLANETWNLKDLLDFSLVVSSNDGSRSIASVIGARNLNNSDYNLGRKEFVSLMNKKAQELNLSQTYFINENGLDIENYSGGYGTAEDISSLVKYIIQNSPELLEATKYPILTVSSQSKIHKIKNTNKDIELMTGLIGSKTGYTLQAGGNLVVALDASIGRPIIIVVLGSTFDGRFSDVLALANSSLDYIKE